VREYVPVGEMIPGMAYLVRRLLENTSNESWLKAGFLENADTAQLLASPHDAPGAERPQDLREIAPERHLLSDATPGVGDDRPFFTEPVRDFAEDHQRAAYARAITAAHVPTVPLDATADDAKRAVDDLDAFFPTWRDTDPIERANTIDRAAQLMADRRDELAGVIIKENGKPWREADADVTEAIDFCRYYAREAPKLFQRGRLGRFIGELDELWHQPRGVAAVISPWNFPLAISCGMTTAALVTGNTVALKPAEQTPAIARILADILYQAGLPEDALRFLSGPGETVGAALVRDPRVSLIAFTGSKAVGLDIIKAAGLVDESAGQRSVKKVVCEMGGKNAIIVDTSADLDEAVLGVRYSAFGFSGQKCSACSRCIVVDPAGPEGPAITAFLERFLPSVRSLVCADPIQPGTDVGPVIDDEAADTIMRAIERAKQEIGPPALEMEHTTIPADSPTIPKRIVGPTVFTNVKPEHDLARNEVFGPVLAVMHAHDYDEALRIANDHPYKLTGAVFSRKPAHIEHAKRDFRVGNLYINRPCTGALVARHPFGGFGMSGVGSKAGGPAYLTQFVEPRACAENTMRRGFAPEL
ncbi:MAG: proline dehydrogenase family protein, partial [Planctomycetota bacterium]